MRSDAATRQPAAATVSTAPTPTEEDIRLRAYHRYLERGGQGGDAITDWLLAERELRQTLKD